MELALGRLLAAESEPGAAIDRVLATGATLDEVLAALDSELAPLPMDDRRARLVEGWSAWTGTDSEGVERPYQLFVPAAVAAGVPATALLVHLHGSVGRADYGEGLGEPAAIGYGPLLWPDVAVRENVVVACPLGRADCAWWTEAGTRHVSAVVRDVRRSLAVPEDAIFASGFSDGASGCYFLGMAAPDPFAGFVAMNGHPAVASSASERELYLENLAGTPLLAAATQDDSLYPSRSVLPHLTSVVAAGGDVHVLSYPGINHQPGYFDEQAPLVRRFLREVRRDARAPVRWFGAAGDVATVRWVEVLATGAAKEGDAPAREAANHDTTPGRVRLGVRLQPGTLVVDRVIDGSLAETLGMRSGDRLTRVGTIELVDVPSLRRALGALVRGEDVVVELARGDEPVVLSTELEPFRPEPIYLRERATVWLDAAWTRSAAGEVELEVTSRGVHGARCWVPRGLEVGGEVRVRWNDRTEQLAVQRLSPAAFLERVAITGAARETPFAYCTLGAGER